MAKILILSCWDDDFDLKTVKGTPTNAYLREYLKRRGIENLFVYPSNKGEASHDTLAVKVKLLPVKRKIGKLVIPVNYFIQNLKIAGTVLKKGGNFDLVYSICSLTSLASKILSKKSGISYAQKFSGLIFFGRYNRVNRWIFDFSTSISLALKPDKIFVVDDGSGGAEPLLKAGVPPEKIVNLPNPLPDEIYGSNPHTPPVVGWIGRFNLLKGVQYLPSIVENLLKIHQSIRVKILGFGEYERWLKEKIPEDRVEFIEGKTYFESLKFYSEIDVYISTNVYANYTRTVLEALANGVPVVAFDVPGTRRLIKDGVNGFVVPPFDAGLFAKRVMDVLKNQERMMAAARKSVEGLPGWEERMTLELNELLKLI